MEQVFLSRRNLQTLLNKLDRVKLGEQSFCTLIKNDNTNPMYPQSMPQVMITAVEDDEYYAVRTPGEVLPVDAPSAAH